MADDSQYASARAPRKREHQENETNWVHLRDAAREIVLAVAKKREGGE